MKMRLFYYAIDQNNDCQEIPDLAEVAKLEEVVIVITPGGEFKETADLASRVASLLKVKLMNISVKPLRQSPCYRETVKLPEHKYKYMLRSGFFVIGGEEVNENV